MVQPEMNNAVTRAILHALPTAVLALDSTDTILLANSAASKLLGIGRDHLEGGPLSRFIAPGTEITNSAHTVEFLWANTHMHLAAVAKELIVDDTIIRVVLLKENAPRHDARLTERIAGLAQGLEDPYVYLCKSIVELGITKNACVRSTTSTQCDILASSTQEHTLFTNSPTITRTISKEDDTHVELVIIPDSVRGLTREDISVVDMFISLLSLRVDNTESATDASGSETVLALALKAGEMGMCFFDTNRGDCYLSDQLATWCGLNPETFSGTVSAWLDTFREDDRARITTLFNELGQHKKFRTVVNIHTLEQDLRLELYGRPLHENSSQEWVAIARLYRDEQEVEAAWHTRIAMEEAAREEAETLLENFERSLTETLLPTTSDVSIMHSRQDAGTWHIVRPIDAHSAMYAVGAVVGTSRSQAVIGATLVATIADVLSATTDDVETFVSLVRDHARARDIETSIAAVRVVAGTVSSATAGGASVFISGKSFVGTTHINATTALSLSSHSEASPETVDVAANGRPWRIMSSVIEYVSVLDTPREATIHENENDKADLAEPEVDMNYAEREFDENVSPFRSGSISPS